MQSATQVNYSFLFCRFEAMEDNNFTTANHYLNSTKAEFKKLKALGDKTFAQLSTVTEFNYKPNEEANSIATIIQHLSGNMISRWTDFLTTDGEKPTRDRDTEFEERNLNKEQLLLIWENGWTVLSNSLNTLNADDIMKQVTIRGEKHTVIQAINRQLTHYAYHIGQIIYITKYIKSADWQTLSIARNKSKEFNQKMADRT